MIRTLLRCIIAAGAILVSGCTKDTLDEGAGGKLDFSKMQEVTLSGISTVTSEQGELAQAQAQSMSTRASTPMAVGKTFRLYAFPKGVTDMDKLVATRTYTIKDAVGDPVLDANQDKLVLPAGEVDIFLVGPVQHNINEGQIDENGNPLSPNMITIASPSGVYPRFGVDLVSSKTALTVKVGANQFQAEPLNHRMAQMEVVVERPITATYTDLNVTSITVMNQTLVGDFVFNASGGEITPAAEGTETLIPEIRTTKPNEEFRATMYVIPRAKVQLRIGVFLTCKVAGSDVNLDRRMESGIIDEALLAGQMNRFTTKPSLSDKLIFRLRLLPWDDVSRGEAGVPTGDKLLFSYSGMDAPRWIDGKWYISDRSGNGNHGEIVGDIRHNTSEHYYYAASEGAYIKVPELGNIPVYTFEMTATSERNAQTVAASFTGPGIQRALGVNLPMQDNEIVFDAGNSSGGALSSANSSNDIAWMDNMAVYAFTRDASTTTIRRNGSTLATASTTPYNGPMTDNRLLWWQSTSGKPQTLKMYAARMTTNVSDDVIKNNYRNDMMTFSGINIPKELANNDYISEGLILDLRGTTGYSTVSGKQVWPDASKSQNHAVVMSTSWYPPAYKNNCYTFDGVGHYMQLLRTLGSPQQYTIELVAKASTVGSTILNFSSDKNGSDGHREFHLHLPWKDSIMCSSPRSNGRTELLAKESMTNLAYTYDFQKLNPNQWSFTRTNVNNKSVLEARLNGYLEMTVSAEEVPLSEMRYCFIGCNGTAIPQWFNSSIYAIRVYSRQLTDAERQHNYQIDKSKYNLVP